MKDEFGWLHMRSVPGAVATGFRDKLESARHSSVARFAGSIFQGCAIPGLRSSRHIGTRSPGATLMPSLRGWLNKLVQVELTVKGPLILTRGYTHAAAPRLVEGSKIMTDIAKDFIAESRSFLSSDYLPKIERCLEGLSDEDVWWRANEESNSIGNLLLHLDGSTRGWIINVAGGANSPRDRQQEFDERGRIPRTELIARLKQTLAEADEVLARLDGATLLERRQTPWKEVTLLWAVYHAVEHFSMHTGQIIILAKMRSRELRLSD